MCADRDRMFSGSPLPSQMAKENLVRDDSLSVLRCPFDALSELIVCVLSQHTLHCQGPFAQYWLVCTAMLVYPSR